MKEAKPENKFANNAFVVFLVVIARRYKLFLKS